MVGELEVAAASLKDVLRSKREFGREKDARAALAIRPFQRDREPWLRRSPNSGSAERFVRHTLRAQISVAATSSVVL
jgi:hypothetical protein